MAPCRALALPRGRGTLELARYSRAVPMPVYDVSSLEDPRVEAFRDVRDRDLRGRGGVFMAESELVVRRLLRHPKRIHSLLLSPTRYEALREAIERTEGEAPVYVAPLELMCAITGFHIHRGALAAGIRPDAADLTIGRALGHLQSAAYATLLVAERLTNVDNMGALFRNAAAFGVDGVLLDPGCCDPLYRKSIRVSMGHVLSVPYAIGERWPGDLAQLKEWGLTIVGAESCDRAISLWRMPRAKRMAMVFGSEGHGLRESTLEFCDAVCEIPMAGEVPSLNVAVASAAFLYERMRPHEPPS